MAIINLGNDSSHILVFPYPAQGHMIPLLDFTNRLATQGLKITILVTTNNLPLLKPLLSTHPSIEPLILPFPSHPSIPPGIENVKDLPPNSFRLMMSALRHLHRPLLHWFQSHPSPPVLIVSDMFLGWTHNLAFDLGIRRVVFSPSGAMALSVIFSLWRNMPKRTDPSDPNEVVFFPDIPYSPRYPWWQISPVYRRHVDGESDPDSEFIKDCLQANLTSWGVVINSFSELERGYFEHLRVVLGHDRVWAVGPLLPPCDDSLSLTNRGGPSSHTCEKLLTWLDTCENNKVVYVCFGSQIVLTDNQTEEVASGLEKSEVHFIWILKEPKTVHVEGDYGRLPSGFEDRVAGRGLVIRGWVPQVLILRHRAVGAFLTHCGWNSVLEGIAAGVMMLAWPMGADQYSNATLLVDQLKVAISVCEGIETVPNSVELSKALIESVVENRVERKCVAELGKVAAEAIKEGGSSALDFRSFLTRLSELEVAKKFVD